MAGIQGNVDSAKPNRLKISYSNIGLYVSTRPCPSVLLISVFLISDFLFGVRLVVRFAFIVIDIDSRATLE